MPPKIPQKPAQSAGGKSTGQRASLRTGASSGGAPAVVETTRHPTAGRASLSSSSPTASNGAARAAAPSTRSRSPVHWLATRPTQLYRGPLGEPCGVVEPGTVILEQHRYLDPFQGWWISTRSEDGHVAWIRHSDDDDDDNNDNAVNDTAEKFTEATGVAQRDPLWRRVYDTRATPAADQSRRRDDDLAAVFSRKRTFTCDTDKGETDILAALRAYSAAASSDIPTELSLYEYYWDNLATQKNTEDWNQRYQSALEGSMFFPAGVCDATLRAAQQTLETVMEQFHARAEEMVTVCVEDLVAPQSQKRCRVHPQHPHVFYAAADALVLVLHQDTPSGTFQGDERARKVASKAFQSYCTLSFEAPRHFLSTPLKTLIAFGGHLFTVSTIPPVSSDGCLFALLTADGVQKAADVPDVLKQFMSSLGSALHLQPHPVSCLVGSSSSALGEVCLPCDVQLYSGRDRRLYVLSTDRVLPPVYPIPREGKLTEDHSAEAARASGVSKGHSASFVLTESLITRIRPELLLRLDPTVCGGNPDVLLPSCCGPADRVTSAELSEFIRDELITQVAGTLGMVFPLPPGVAQPQRVCNLCANVLDADEMRFGACRGHSGDQQHQGDTTSPYPCCFICSHCYTKRVHDALLEVDPSWADDDLHQTSPDAGPTMQEDGAAQILWRKVYERTDFSDAVKCGGTARPANGLVVEPSVTTVMHSVGLNLRYLPFVLNRLPNGSRLFVKSYVEIEMVARAAAKVLSSKLRKAPSADEVQKRLSTFMVAFLQSQGPETLKLWAREIGPEIQRSFKAVHSPLDLSACSRELLAERLCELSGVRLTSSSLASLSAVASGEAFVQIESALPRTKRMVPFRCADVSAAEAQTQRFRQMLEPLLLFWIRYAPKGCDNSLQPTYLQRLIEDN